MMARRTRRRPDRESARLSWGCASAPPRAILPLPKSSSRFFPRAARSGADFFGAFARLRTPPGRIPLGRRYAAVAKFIARADLDVRTHTRGFRPRRSSARRAVRGRDRPPARAADRECEEETSGDENPRTARPRGAASPAGSQSLTHGCTQRARARRCREARTSRSFADQLDGRLGGAVSAADQRARRAGGAHVGGGGRRRSRARRARRAARFSAGAPTTVPHRRGTAAALTRLASTAGAARRFATREGAGSRHELAAPARHARTAHAERGPKRRRPRRNDERGRVAAEGWCRRRRVPHGGEHNWLASSHREPTRSSRRGRARRGSRRSATGPHRRARADARGSTPRTPAAARQRGARGRHLRIGQASLSCGSRSGPPFALRARRRSRR